MTQDAIQSAAEDLLKGLLEIPASELVACARQNLQATYRVRLSKDDPEGKEVPDYPVRQKALEWIAAQRAGTAPGRKAIEPKADDKDSKASPGMLRGKKPTDPKPAE